MLSDGHRFRTICFACAIAFLAALYPPYGIAQIVLDSQSQQIDGAFNPQHLNFNTVRLGGTVTWTAGGLNETGTILLQASIDGSVREEWNLTSRTHSEVRTPFTANRSCTWEESAGIVQDMSRDPDCFRPVPWFAPWLTTPLISGGLLVSPGISRQAASSYLQITYQPSSTIVSLPSLGDSTSSTISYDNTTHLPAVVEYNYLTNSSSAIKYKIIFSNFYPDSGLILPHRIQRYVQRSLQADIVVTTITVE